MAGSIALRRLIIARKPRVMPRRSPGVVDLHPFEVYALVSPVHDGDFRRDVAQDCRLFQRFCKRVAIVRIAWHRAHANDQPFLVRRRDRHLYTELVRRTRLALGQTLHLWRMQCIKLVWLF